MSSNCNSIKRESMMRDGRKLLLAGALALAGTAFYSPGAGAGQSSGTMAVSANVAGGCTVSAAGMNFGTLAGPTSTAVQASADVTVTCALNAQTPNITVNTAGNGTRSMTNGANSLVYTIYKDAGFTTPFSGQNGTSLAVTLPATGTPTATVPIYAQTATGVALVAGNYADSATIYVNF
jgi:spore coat protein U-like protein